MRVLSIAILTASTFALGSSAFAAPMESRDTPVVQHNATTSGYDAPQYGTFSTNNIIGYHPCPADVVFPDGHHACLGQPD